MACNCEEKLVLATRFRGAPPNNPVWDCRSGETHEYLSDWFSYAVKPPVPGVYNVCNDAGQTHFKQSCYWDGQRWTRWDTDRGIHNMDENYSYLLNSLESLHFPGDYNKNVSWRGLRHEQRSRCLIRFAEYYTRPKGKLWPSQYSYSIESPAPAGYVQPPKAEVPPFEGLEVVPFMILLNLNVR